MAIFAVASVVMFWITFATTKERVTPPPEQKTNVREELGELFRNWPWVMLLIASIFSTTFIALRAGSTIFYFKYVVGDDKHSDLPRDSTAPPSSLPPARWPGARHRCAWASIARRVDKKYCAAALSAVTGVCFLALLLPAQRQFGLHARGERAGPVLHGADLGAHLGAVRRRGRLRGVEIRPPIHRADLFGVAVLRSRPASLSAASCCRCSWLASAIVKDAEQTATALLGITLAFSLVPGVIRAAQSRCALDLSAQPKARGRNRTGTGRPPRRRVS